MEIRDVNIVSFVELPTPREVKEEIQISEKVIRVVLSSRETVKKILDRRDNRLLLITGPCSIHDEKAALDYAQKLKKLLDEVSDRFFVIMRVYFEKPRTTIGWKGFLNDPNLDGSCKIDEGLRRARRLMVQIGEMGVPIATETLDPIVPQYLDDLITWTAIGARTVESQTHREIASGLSMPVGFKNSTDGSYQPALNALKAVSQEHFFLGIDIDGRSCVCHTRGNKYAHIVLRGGKRPNYDSVSIDMCEEDLKANGLPPNIMIDCSHGNSCKKAEMQGYVMNNCISQIVEGNTSIIGLMLESNLFAGNQKITDSLQYGVSITDACIGWDETVKIVKESQKRLENKK